MTSCVSRWWTPNATQWIPATPPSMSPRPSTCQRTPTVTAAAAAPCRRACAGGRRAPDASTTGTGMVSLPPVITMKQQCSSTSVCRCDMSASTSLPLPLCRPAYSPDSGECKRPAGKDPSSWGVEEVISFIKDADPQALGPHADAFRKHVRIFYIGH